MHYVFPLYFLDYHFVAREQLTKTLVFLRLHIFFDEVSHKKIIYIQE